jgi:hypothetical protein
MAMRSVLMGLVVVPAAVLSLGLASPAAAAPTNCQTVGAATVCGQGMVSGPGVTANSAPIAAPSSGSGSCTNQYGTYQRC